MKKGTFLIVLSVFFIASCGGGGGSNNSSNESIVGEWTLVTYGGVSVSENGFGGTFTATNDGSYSVIMTGTCQGAYEFGTYATSGNTIYFTITSVQSAGSCMNGTVGQVYTLSYTISGNTLSLANNSGEVMTATR